MKKSQLKRKKKMRILAATLGVAALIVGGLTFAWYTSQDSVTNTFQADGTFKTVVVENFNPPTNWEPGTTTDKVVQVTNTGTIDAYTRVELVPELSFDRKTGSTTQIGDGITTDITTDSSYAQVNAAAIDTVVENWNTAQTNDNDKYVQITSDNVSTYFGDNQTIPDNVTLYIKKSTGTTDYQSGTADVNNSNIVTVGTTKYELLGYYTAEKPKSDTNDSTSSSTNEADKVYYELAITFDNSALREAGYDYSDEDGFVTVKTTEDSTDTVLSGDIKFSLYNVNHVEINANSTEDTYNNYVTLNFNDTFGTDGAGTNWYKGDDGYYYYRKILKSGASTEPLLKSVTFRDDVDMEDLSNLTFNLTVNETSTQAIMEAGIGTFGTESGTFINSSDLTKSNNFAAIIIDDQQNWKADFSKTDSEAAEETTQAVAP